MIAVIPLLVAGCGAPPAQPPRVSFSAVTDDLIDIPSATYSMGDAFGVEHGRADEEPRKVVVVAFRLMKYEVTNDQFADFVAKTGYRTHPETRGFGMVWPGKWLEVEGADWRHPYGPATSIEEHGDYPVVQVSVSDAAAFCAHYRMRLPTETEWELAARGTDGRRYPWGNDEPVQSSGAPRANFGTVACCGSDARDGYRRIAPVGRYPAGVSPYGIHDMAGNVWEWTSDLYNGQPNTAALRGGGWGNNPFCLRVSYRHGNNRNVGRDHIGFRCAADR